MKRLKLLFLIVFLSFVFSGCAMSSIPEDTQVIDIIKEQAQDDSIEFKYSEVTAKDKEGNPQDVKYYFSTDRFDFTATASTYIIFGDNEPIDKGIESQYFDAVFSLYEKDLRKIIPVANMNFDAEKYFDEDLILNMVLEADKIYKEELKYHTQEWMTEHPLDILSFTYYPEYDPHKTTKVYSTYVEILIDGTNTEESVREIFKQVKNLPQQAEEEAALMASMEMFFDNREKEISSATNVREMLDVLKENIKEDNVSTYTFSDKKIKSFQKTGLYAKLFDFETKDEYMILMRKDEMYLMYDDVVYDIKNIDFDSFVKTYVPFF